MTKTTALKENTALMMRAMAMEQPKQPLQLKNLKAPKASEKQVFIKVIACGVCRTDLHIIDGKLSAPKLPLIMGHEIIGTVYVTGSKLTKPKNHGSLVLLSVFSTFISSCISAFFLYC